MLSTILVVSCRRVSRHKEVSKSTFNATTSGLIEYQYNSASIAVSEETINYIGDKEEESKASYTIDLEYVDGKWVSSEYVAEGATFLYSIRGADIDDYIASNFMTMLENGVKIGDFRYYINPLVVEGSFERTLKDSEINPKEMKETFTLEFDKYGYITSIRDVIEYSR